MHSRIELLGILELRHGKVFLAHLEQHNAQSLMRTGGLGIEFDPCLQMLLGLFPFLAGLMHGGIAGMAADIEIALALRVISELGGELCGLGEQQIGLNQAAVTECQIAEQEVGLRIACKLADRCFQFGAGLRQLIHTHPQHRHHHAWRGSLGVIRFDPLQHRAASVDVAVAKAVDGVGHFL